MRLHEWAGTAVVVVANAVAVRAASSSRPAERPLAAIVDH
jgi:hypothetical protein